MSSANGLVPLDVGLTSRWLLGHKLMSIRAEEGGQTRKPTSARVLVTQAESGTRCRTAAESSSSTERSRPLAPLKNKKAASAVPIRRAGCRAAWRVRSLPPTPIHCRPVTIGWWCIRVRRARCVSACTALAVYVIAKGAGSVPYPTAPTPLGGHWRHTALRSLAVTGPELALP